MELTTGLNATSGRNGAEPSRRPRRHQRVTFRGYVEAQGISWEKMWRMLRKGELPAHVGGVAVPMSLKGYARGQGVHNMAQIRRAYREGLLPLLVGACPPGGGKWARIPEIAGLAVLYSSATMQLGSLKRALALEQGRLARTGPGPRSGISAG